MESEAALLSDKMSRFLSLGVFRHIFAILKPWPVAGLTVKIYLKIVLKLNFGASSGGLIRCN